MRYSEFREYLKVNEIYLKEDEEKLIVDSQLEISKTEECSIWFSLGFVEYPHECQLLKKVIELAETPIDEREGEKKYYIKHKFINNYTTWKYINLITTGKVVLSDLHDYQDCKTKFTKAEIEAFKKRFDTDLRDFDLVEAED